MHECLSSLHSPYSVTKVSRRCHAISSMGSLFLNNSLANLLRLQSEKCSATSRCISFTRIFGCKHCRDSIKPVRSFLHIALDVQRFFLLSSFFSVVTFLLHFLLSAVAPRVALCFSAIFHVDNTHVAMDGYRY